MTDAPASAPVAAPASPAHVSHRPIRNWKTSESEHRSIGERAADHLRNGMGSWPFVFSFVGAMVVWAIVNTLPIKWDPYPFILLNLFLSMLAGLQGAILLIAAKRADAVSAALAQHDFETNVAAKKELETLMSINQRQLGMLDELRTIVDQNTTEIRRLSEIQARLGPGNDA